MFLVLYVVAAQYYPGGSQADQASRGFDWVHNYWCNLVMVVVNNVLYHYKPWIGALPVVQKITFLMFLGWVFWISVKLYSRAGNNHKFGR